MGHRNVRDLVTDLIGHQVKVFFDDEKQCGRIAAVTDDVLVLCSDDDVLYVNSATVAHTPGLAPGRFLAIQWSSFNIILSRHAGFGPVPSTCPEAPYLSSNRIAQG